MNESKWYDNKLIVLALTVICFPLGLYALWKGNSFGKTGKTVITIIVGLIALTIAGKNDETTSASSAKRQAYPSVQSSAKNEVPEQKAAKVKKTIKQANKPKGISKQTYDAIKIGMSKKEVLDMLGEPTSKSKSYTQGVGTIEIFQWQTTGFFNGIKAITVFFNNDKVYNKNWTEM